MFRLINMTNVSLHLAVRITSPTGDVSEYFIGPTINKCTKDELIPEKQFELMNAYLSYKGDAFKTVLYNKIKEAEVYIDGTCFIRGIANPPSEPIHRILDLFDFPDIVNFVKTNYKITPPANLMASFSAQIESDGLGTRIQTYIQEDYYELAALTIPIKAILGLLTHYGNLKEGSIAKIHKEYALYMLFSEHPLMKTAPVIKLYNWISILMSTTVDKPDLQAISVIEKQVPIEELASYVLAVVLIQKVGIAAIVTDDRSKNVITRVYNYIINKLKAKAGSNSKIRDKKPLGDVDSVNEDKESIVEAYRIVSNITPGTEVELSWYLGNINFLIRDNKYDVSVDDVEAFISVNQCFREIAITKEQVTLASYLISELIDPRALDYVDADSIINVLSIAGAILWKNGHMELAVLVNAKPIPISTGDIDINNTPNIRLDVNLKTELNKLYPYQKQLNKNKTVSIIETAVSELTNRFFTRKWVANLPEAYMKKLYGNTHPKVLPTDLKNKLAKLIIDIKGDNH